MSPRKAQPLKIEYAILGLIRRQPAHGYELLQSWQDGLDIIWHVKAGQFYAALDKLEQQEWLIFEVVQAGGYPPRKVYTICQEGEQAYVNWMCSPVLAPREFRQEFLARRYFFDEVDPKYVQTLLRKQVQTCQGWLAEQQQKLATFTGFALDVGTYRLQQMQGIWQWLEALKNRYDKE